MYFKFIFQIVLIGLAAIGLIILILVRDKADLTEIENRGSLYLRFLEPAIRLDYRKLNSATWEFYSNPNNQTLDLYLEAVVKYNQFVKEIKTEIEIYPWRRFRNSTSRRTFELIENMRSYSLSNCSLKSLAKFRIYESSEAQADILDCNVERERDPEFNIKLAEFVTIFREDAGSENAVNKMLRAQFQMPGKDIRRMINKIWNDIRPLHQFLGYNGNINKHSPQLVSINKTDVKTWTLRKIYTETDRYYASKMGWILETPNFWNRSLFKETGPCRNKILCDLSPKADDCRVRACNSGNGSIVNFLNARSQIFVTKYYQMASKQVHLPLRGLGSEILPQAIGRAFNLIPAESRYNFFGLEIKPNSPNRLALEGTELLTRLARYMTNQQWIWDLIENRVSLRKANAHYWKLRTTFEGVELLGNYSEYTIPQPCWSNANLDDSMKFLVEIMKFQIHSGLCKISGYDENQPMHLCDFTKGTGLSTVRQRLNEIMKAGSSQNWIDVLFDLTRERSVNAKAMLKYFQPITKGNVQLGNYG